jgi:hypothetical protein
MFKVQLIKSRFYFRTQIEKFHPKDELLGEELSPLLNVR